jgi:hypothetical protein
MSTARHLSRPTSNAANTTPPNGESVLLDFARPPAASCPYAFLITVEV